MLFTEKDFKCKYLANMGISDEFGDNFLNEHGLFNKISINFSPEEPMLMKY